MKIEKLAGPAGDGSPAEAGGLAGPDASPKTASMFLLLIVIVMTVCDSWLAAARAGFPVQY